MVMVNTTPEVSCVPLAVGVAVGVGAGVGVAVAVGIRVRNVLDTRCPNVSTARRVCWPGGTCVKVRCLSPRRGSTHSDLDVNPPSILTLGTTVTSTRSSTITVVPSITSPLWGERIDHSRTGRWTAVSAGVERGVAVGNGVGVTVGTETGVAVGVAVAVGVGVASGWVQATNTQVRTISQQRTTMPLHMGTC